MNHGCEHRTDGRSRNGSRGLRFRASPLLVVLSLLTVLFAAGWLRFANLDFGIPHYYHTDEHAKVVRVLLPMVRRGGWNPRYFLHPPFLLYSTLLGARGYAALSGSEFDQFLLLRSGRTVSAVTGVLTVLFVFLLARRLYGAGWALLAAGLLASFPLHVQCSHYMKEDVFVTMWITLQLLFCVRYIQQGRRSDWLLAGACTGLAAATKYIGALIGVMLPLSLWLRWRTLQHDGVEHSDSAARPGHAATELGLALALAGICFFVVNPWMVLDPASAAGGLGDEMQHAARGHFGGILAISPWQALWTYHLRESLAPGVGIVPLVMAFIGGVLAFRRREPGPILMVGWVLVGYFFQEASPLKPPPQPERYMVIILPPLAVLGAYALARMACLERLLRARPAVRVALLGGIVSALLLPPLWRSSVKVVEMVPDTRDLAGAWMVENCEAGANVLIDGRRFYAPRVEDRLRTRVVRHTWRTFSASLRSSTKEHPIGQRLDLRTGVLDAGTGSDEFRADYLVLTSFWYRRWIDYPNAPRAARQYYTREIPEVLGEPLKVFRARSGSFGYSNPVIKLYRLGADATATRASASRGRARSEP